MDIIAMEFERVTHEVYAKLAAQAHTPDGIRSVAKALAIIDRLILHLEVFRVHPITIKKKCRTVISQSAWIHQFEMWQR